LKIFISHSSTDSAYGSVIVDLLRSVGIKEDEIIFTSNIAYGIPLGESIFNWLKNQIKEKPYVVYLLSSSYYSSVACLNEMGAAWIVENDHTIIFTPDFNINSPEFQNGALDPREIGFYINNEERLLSFLELLRKSFEISTNRVLISQKIKESTEKILHLGNKRKTEIKPNQAEFKSVKPTLEIVNNLEPEKKVVASSGYYTQFLSDIDEGKLNNEELLLICYILDTAKVKLGTGWQEGSEIQTIKEWEDIQGLNDNLSRNYNSILRRFELRKYTEVSAYTSSGNPKEIKLVEVIQEKILDLPQKLLSIIENVKKNNLKDLKTFGF
jgi:hypothetical protein